MNVLRDFQQVGADLFAARLNNTHSGNLSLRLNRMLAITRTGSMLHRLGHNDVVETLIDGDDLETPRASREIPVHRAIYRATGAQAVVHAHPPHVIALSLLVDRIMPLDGEGRYYFPNGIPILTVDNPVGSEEVARGLPPLLKTSPIVVVRGHGTFAFGTDLESGLHWTSSLDNIAQIVLLSRSGMHSLLASPIDRPRS